MEKDRIIKDIELFEKNVKAFGDDEVVDMAKRYYEDAKYYVSKRDFFTAFGCINYAHGLIDGLKMKGFKDEKML